MLSAVENFPSLGGVGSRLLLSPTMTREKILRSALGDSVAVVRDLYSHESIHIVVNQR